MHEVKEELAAISRLGKRVGGTAYMGILAFGSKFSNLCEHIAFLSLLRG